MRLRYRVRILSRARTDLKDIRAWLTQPGSGPRGRHRYAAIVQAIGDLGSSPFRWAFGDHPDTRERPVERHRILYQVNEPTKIVEILRVFSPYQNRSTL